MVVRGETVHFFQDAKPDTEHEILHGAEANKCRQRRKAEPANIDPEEARRDKEQEVEIFFEKNSVDQPLDEQRIKQVHQAAQNDQGDTKYMCAEKRPQLASKPAELHVEIRCQEDSWRFLTNLICRTKRLVLAQQDRFIFFVGQRPIGLSEMIHAAAWCRCQNLRNSAGVNRNMS